MQVKLVQAADPNWNAEIDRIGALLDAQHNPEVFPYHFLQVVLPRLGGSMVEISDGQRYLLAGFLFPRGIAADQGGPNTQLADSARVYTFRYHALTEAAEEAAFIETVSEALREELQAAAIVNYSPREQQTFTRTDHDTGRASIGRPSEEEAAHVRDVHQEIWNSPPEYLYPSDIHSDEFHLGTSLVARVDGRVAGFLFGFYRFGGPTLPSDWSKRFGGKLRVESQVMGVSPRFRGMRLGNLLKRSQAHAAQAEGIGLIHWTADPLQYPNAALNFGLLRAVAFSFTPDYYPFRNDLNRVPASRFAVTWLISTRRVRDIPVSGSPALILDLVHQPHIARVNDACRGVDMHVDDAVIAIEIPADWVAMQRDDLSSAMAWREITDEIFKRYVGIREGQYVITGAAVDGDRRYLVGERVEDALWQHLAQ